MTRFGRERNTAARRYPRYPFAETGGGSGAPESGGVFFAPRAGTYRIELRITARTSGQFNVANWVQWDNMRLIKTPEEKFIDAVVDVDPNTLNLNSQGAWITCYIELPAGYNVNDIQGETVTLETINAYMGKQDWACPEANAANTVDHDGDGVMERMVKFDRSAVQAVLHRGTATVMVTGKLPNHTTLRGTDLIKVIGGGGGQN